MKDALKKDSSRNFEEESGSEESSESYAVAVRDSHALLAPVGAALASGASPGELALISPMRMHRRQCPTCGERYPSDFRHCPRDATQLVEQSAEESDPLIGVVLADTYQILRMIGEGGMGRVYEARHTRLTSKRLAIKVLHADLSRQPQVVGRFLREAEATGALQHPNIVGVLDVNELPDGRPYIVAELLQGQQLGSYLERRGKLPVAEAVAICRPICRALMAAHDKGIVHRDIKPENLFLVGDGSSRTTKVLDFGISRVGSAAAKLTKTGTVMGTPTYMPPEQARGRRVDHRADVYSVGAILYEAVTGRRPFDGEEPMATLAAVLTEDPPRPSSVVPSIPQGLELVIQKAMAKAPRDRYSTMRELDDALAEFDSGPNVVVATAHTVSEPSPSPAAAKPPTRAGAPRFETQFFRMWGGVYNALEQARTNLVAYSIFSALYVFAGSLEVGLGLVRVSRGSAPLTSAEIAFAALASLGLLMAPCILWTWFLAKHVWPSTPRVMDVLDRIRLVLGASLGVYAGLTLFIRILGSTLHIDPSGIAWPGWGVLSFVLAAVVGGATAHNTIKERTLAD
ncbi:MAG TPA: serine/threonine-protein kinase [Polyangiales bacterium]|nr:serine/threonine-protein kinase [Polyangiales bacterium]